MMSLNAYPANIIVVQVKIIIVNFGVLLKTRESVPTEKCIKGVIRSEIKDVLSRAPPMPSG